MRFKTVSKPVLLAALIALCAPSASQAQYFNASYSLLYPLSYLLRGGGYGYNSYANPFYLLNTVGRNSYYSPLGYMPYQNYGGNLNNGPFGYGPNNNNNNNNANQNNYNPATNTSSLSGQPGYNPYQPNYPQNNNNNNPSNGFGGSNYGANNQQIVKDQIAYANRSNNQQAPQQQQFTQYQPQQTPQISQNTYPGLAPSHNPVAKLPGGSTFANSFLDTLENKYHGNLDMAFRDRDFVSWAQALNIPVKSSRQYATIGSVRKQAINSVLKDSSLDSTAKIQALKVLLR